MADLGTLPEPMARGVPRPSNLVCMFNRKHWGISSGGVITKLSFLPRRLGPPRSWTTPSSPPSPTPSSPSVPLPRTRTTTTARGRSHRGSRRGKRTRGGDERDWVGKMQPAHAFPSVAKSDLPHPRKARKNDARSFPSPEDSEQEEEESSIPPGQADPELEDRQP
jgi:hypothetical protein